ncbi:ribonuclease H-like domain-containing protein [Candidatus Woesebacteria bacterium]|nr:ribonuclease H-like domain-containing protein [Candidatus Woesebacteria bacterium]
MQKFPIVLDLETQHTFREFSEPEKLKVSLVGIYNYADRRSQAFREDELARLFPLLENASYVIGYNITSFDMPVLRPYYAGDIASFALFDILDDIKRITGRRIGLNDVARATFDEKKSGHGLMAIDYFKEGKWEELEKYCLDDVTLTKKVFEVGLKNGVIYGLDETGKYPIRVDWKHYMEDNGSTNMPLTLPF